MSLGAEKEKSDDQIVLCPVLLNRCRPSSAALVLPSSVDESAAVDAGHVAAVPVAAGGTGGGIVAAARASAVLPAAAQAVSPPAVADVQAHSAAAV